MKLPFLGQAYQSRSPILASQTAINIFPETTEGNSAEVGAFYGTPGIATVFTGSGEVRGLYSAGAYLWAAIGKTLWRLDAQFNGLNVGTLSTSTGPVSMYSNETQLLVADSVGWYWIALNGTAIAPVAGAPGGSVLTGQDLYGIYTDGSGLFGLTTLADLSTFDPLDVADAETQPDSVVSIATLNNELWLLGNDTTELWDDVGSALFPFQRNTGVYIESGVCGPWAVAKGGLRLFWLARDRSGEGTVLSTIGYTPVRVSTHPIEYAINQYSNIANCRAWTYTEEGHLFVVFTFPAAVDGTGDATWVYDATAKGWHQRAWRATDGTLHRHRANCYAQFNGQHIVGDWQNGKVYRQSLNIYTDDGAPIYRARAFEVPGSDRKRVRVDDFEVYALLGDGDPAGAAVDLSLTVSRDGGRSFGYERVQSVGALGQTMARARWRRPARGRDLVFRTSTTMANRVHWVNARMDAEALGV